MGDSQKPAGLDRIHYPSGKKAVRAEKYISLYEQKQAVKKDYKTQVSKLDKKAIEHYKLALTYTKQGSIDRAIQEYKKAIAIEFTFAVAHYNMGILYSRKKNNKKVLKRKRKELKRTPKRIKIG